MKKLVVLFLSAGAFFTANAQVQFGVKAGANFATLAGSGADGAKTKVDFHGGAFAHIPLMNSFFCSRACLFKTRCKSGIGRNDFT
jgi:hypothetical protein